MITAADLDHLLTAVVPLYVAMILAYGSVKWWRMFSPDQLSGINRFVALFAVPLLSFHFISTNDPYAMNYRFIAADTLQKLIVLTVLAIWTKTSSRGCLEWTITLFSLATLPNTLVMGIPLLKGRWDVEMPAIIASSISILSDAGLGMAMFGLGLFMALQPRIIACGNSVAAFAMAVRFVIGPAVMAAASVVVGLRGVLLQIAIVQAALPQGIVPFVFAKEYNVHPDILSTAVIFGMLIALPITLVYYIFLGL
ncbi:Auxin efflux carrier component [Cocos nucifera]|uniref:Auxin efflux carrier component n=1 Tax=Cocos nucifera TaxID=13894 RepID=A0A8K0IRN7_COCNU|nr:Auxin efflux carrier component [Cocos nucifera]